MNRHKLTRQTKSESSGELRFEEYIGCIYQRPSIGRPFLFLYNEGISVVVTTHVAEILYGENESFKFKTENGSVYNVEKVSDETPETLFKL